MSKIIDNAWMCVIPLLTLAQAVSAATMSPVVNVGTGMPTVAAPTSQAHPAMPLDTVTAKALSRTDSAAVKAATKEAGVIKTGPDREESVDPATDKTALARRVSPVAENDFQRFVRQATGQTLPLFGHDLFEAGGATYAPLQNIPATPDYSVGPGDELLIRVWGALDIELRAMVDRTGQISIPKVGTFSVMGIKAAELDTYIKSKIGRVFRNFEVNVTLGQLRSIQIYVVGHAHRPGTHTVSSLSTLIHGLFASGGASQNGSMRHIQLKRKGIVIAEVDLYDFITLGNNQADMRLQSGDVIVIPPVGARVALGGATARPAIYELSDKSNVRELIKWSTGRLAVTTTTLMASLERIDPTRNPSRTVTQLSLDEKGWVTTLKDGDIVTLYPISARIDNLVALDRSGSPVLRLPWRSGLHIKDLLVRDQLLTDAYWDRINQGQNIAGPQKYEINWDYATVQRLDEQKLKTETFAFALDRAMAGDVKENIELRPGDIVKLYDHGQETPVAQNTVELGGSLVGGVQRFPWREKLTVKDLVRDEQWLVDRYNYWQRFAGSDVKGQINWDYASIVRRNLEGLSKEVIAFNLRQALRDPKAADNHLLQPGDILTLFSSVEMPLPQARQTRLARIEGEVNAAGVYQLQPGETLRQMVQRAGGLTAQAYVFGTEFTREETRRQQQERLDQATQRLEAMTTSEATRQLSNLSGTSNEQASQAQILQQQQQQQQQQQLARLKTLKSNGRIALELATTARQVQDFPDLPLHDGDRIHIPARSAYVMAVGAVNNDNALIWKPGRTVDEVLALAGLTEAADMDNAFVLRADGTVLSRRQKGDWLFSLSSGFEGMELMPGDAVVIPEKLDRKTGWTNFMVGLKDWTQILYQMGIGVAAWKTIQ